MFRFFCKNLRFVANTAPIIEIRCLSNNPSLLASFRYVSSNKITNGESFTVTYLVNSCGLSPQSALSASKFVHFEARDQPDSVLSLLKKHGFSQTQISSIIKRYPRLLLSNPEKTIVPKFEFFQSKEFSSSDIVNIVLSLPLISGRSLKNHIIPTFYFLKNLLQSDKKVVATIKRCHLLLNCNLEKDVVSKINILQEHGVSKSNIITLFHYWPQTFIMNFDKFKKIVEEARDMGFNPAEFRFVSAVRALKGMSKSTWERKVGVYKRWDLSEKDILESFRMEPIFMTHSEDKIMAAMDVFVNKLGWESSIIAKHPTLMGYSLKKRLIPRASVLQFLVSKGLVKDNFRSTTMFRCPETIFVQNFVNRYDEAPEILKLYCEKLALST